MRTVGLNTNLSKFEKLKLKIKAFTSKLFRFLKILLKWIFKHIFEIVAVVISIIALLKQ